MRKQLIKKIVGYIIDITIIWFGISIIIWESRLIFETFK